ncbi:PepSY-associated transmembrane protein [Saccharopolyspora erythraea NRRL 2338]|uniref:Integral membrane protein n=2 Tax=Saccharopolyspora erythraea TaxID=1836 RepID=A4FCJ5_SACEN|nr:PepSY domain-containing protein [Saccharopolyspora erythraea]EQD87423.1 peptidase [Saccharopolyspora erythraea D]PFG95534.1 PepSY-associated transmembrane protein [Saccharopolyspora erythraea NRRL 2338]QRK92158.1 PepSY domain-containing protein [Saccharopolyspora erythraea]CAM01770.1 integral membrane protein [Saccharopolyspora erythraea NRRL 2338]
MTRTTTDQQTRPPAPPRDAALNTLRLLSRRVHFLAGIVVAPFLVVLALTGLVYVFSPQIHESLYRSQLFVAEVDGIPAPVSEQVRAALDAHPEATLRSVIPPPEPDRTTQVQLAVPGLDAEQSRTVFVDPYTNFINGEMNTDGHRTPANMWLRELHSNLHLGEPGRVYAELAATWLPLIVLGGLVLWLAQPRGRRGPTTRDLLVPWSRSAKGWMRLRSVHGALGLWLGVGLLALGLSGLGISQFAGGRADQAADPAHFRDHALVSDPVELPADPTRDAEPPGIALPVPQTPAPRPEPAPRIPVAEEPAAEEPAAPSPEPPDEPEPPAPTRTSTPDAPAPTPPPAPPTTTEQPPPPESPAPPADDVPPPVTTPPPDSTPAPVPTLPLPLIPSLGVELAAHTTEFEPAPMRPQSAGDERIGIDRALAVARAEGLTGELVVTPPHGADGVFSVAERSNGVPVQRDRVAVDPYSGKVVERVGWEDFSLVAKATTLAAEFHTGTLFGLANQILLALLAVGLLVLIGLGYRMWWVHNPYRGRWATLPPPVWRQLPRPVLAAALVSVAALSWAMPLFGPSLLLFVLVDAVITAGLRRRRAGAAAARG